MNMDLILYILGAIVTLAAAVAAVKQLLKPLLKPIQELQEDNKIVMESLLLLMEHAETDNATHKIAEQRMKVRQYLINR